MTDVQLTASAETAPDTPRRRFVRAFMQDRVALAGLLVFLTIMALALLAPWITPQNPYDLNSVDLMDSRLKPGEDTMAGFKAWLGTDGVGRDLYSGILYGLRISLMVGALAGLLAASFGEAKQMLLSCGWLTFNCPCLPSWWP
jgi:peptide/nickel transport system permease protein